MCRLFGLYANKPVSVYFSFFESPVGSFEELSHDNPGGWGVAWFDNSWRIYKEPMPLYSSVKAREVIRRSVRGRIIISHVRFPSCGNISRGNTHPWLYMDWVFAHNGTIYDRASLLDMLDEECRDLEGDTDSEAFFHLIIQEVIALGDPIEGIKNAIRKIVDRGIGFSSLNFIASNGRELYALRYATRNLDYYTLYYIERPKEGLGIERLSEKTKQLISMKLTHGEKAVIIASEPMSDEPYWRLIPNKHLAIVDSNLNIRLIQV